MTTVSMLHPPAQAGAATIRAVMADRTGILRDDLTVELVNAYLDGAAP